jgi:hypothetical protein
MLKGNFCVGNVGETIGDNEDDEVKEEPPPILPPLTLSPSAGMMTSLFIGIHHEIDNRRYNRL